MLCLFLLIMHPVLPDESTQKQLDVVIAE